MIKPSLLERVWVRLLQKPFARAQSPSGIEQFILLDKFYLFSNQQLTHWHLYWHGHHI